MRGKRAFTALLSICAGEAQAGALWLAPRMEPPEEEDWLVVGEGLSSGLKGAWCWPPWVMYLRWASTPLNYTPRQHCENLL